MAIIYMSQEGYDKLKAEINHLVTVERPHISEQIAEARDKGDLSENAEYDAAKEAQGYLEMKIAQKRKQFMDARVIAANSIDTETVQLLTTVTIENVKSGKSFDYTIVSETEANMKEKKISVSTPIAKGLLGHKIGEKVEITTPGGVMTFEIKNIKI